MKPQAIAGVSAGTDREIETVYPSIAATWLGKFIGSLCDCLPVRICGVKLSVMIFALPLAPLSLVPYFLLKVLGRKYVLTNRAVRIKSALGDRLYREVMLNEIDNLAVDVQGGQGFYHAGNLVLLKSNGDAIATLDGVTRPARLRQVILEARDARLQCDASLATIEARQPQPA